MLIRRIDAPRTNAGNVASTLPDSCQGDFQRFDFEPPQPHRHTHFFSVLNARSMEPFKNELWLNRSGLGGVSALIARNIRVVGASVLYSKDALFLSDEEFPGYLEQLFSNPVRKNKHDQFNSAPPDLVLEHAFVISHFLSKIYGHSLLEVFPKLALVKHYYDHGMKIPILLGHSEPGFVADFIRIAIPDAVIVEMLSEEGALVKNCLIPSQCKMYLLTPFHRKFFDELANKCQSLYANDVMPDKILVSRENIAANFRDLENWEEIKRIAIDYGYSEVCPEKLPLAQQISMFARAKSILGEYGSALHNSIFAQQKTHVIALNWINMVQQAIGLVRGQANIFILGDDGKPVLAPPPNTAGPIPIQKFSVPCDVVSQALDFVNGEM